MIIIATTELKYTGDHLWLSGRKSVDIPHGQSTCQKAGVSTEALAFFSTLFYFYLFDGHTSTSGWNHHPVANGGANWLGKCYISVPFLVNVYLRILKEVYKIL